MPPRSCELVTSNCAIDLVIFAGAAVTLIHCSYFLVTGYSRRVNLLLSLSLASLSLLLSQFRILKFSIHDQPKKFQLRRALRASSMFEIHQDRSIPQTRR